MKRRKLNSKAMFSFYLFGFLVVMIIAGFGFIAVSAAQTEQEAIELASGTLVYDRNANPIQLNSAGDVSKKWTGNYYLTLEDKTRTDLGSNTLASSGDSIWIFGGGYRVLEDASVIQLGGYHQTQDLSDDQFYKLADRKYLMTGATLNDEGELVNTAGFLYIVMDRQGNALLMNDQVTVKTTEPAILHSPTFVFDIANELLTIGEREVDMKEVIRTTNEYDPTLYKDEDAEDPEKNPEEIDLDVQGRRRRNRR